MKTAQLTGPALDWAVDKSLNLNTPYNSWGQIGKVPAYSTDWGQGGPIIERERIETCPVGDEWRGMYAYMPDYRLYGPTLLIAAMRCVVNVNLGDEVKLPQHFLEGTA